MIARLLGLDWECSFPFCVSSSLAFCCRVVRSLVTFAVIAPSKIGYVICNAINILVKQYTQHFNLKDSRYCAYCLCTTLLTCCIDGFLVRGEKNRRACAVHWNRGGCCVVGSTRTCTVTRVWILSHNARGDCIAISTCENTHDNVDATQHSM